MIEDFCELAANPAAIARIRTKLESSRSTAPCFDSRARTRHIEAACSAMYERYHAGLAPEHIEVVAA